MSIRDELIRIVADADADIDERPFPDRIVDAILTKFAVVELPEPHGEGDRIDPYQWSPPRGYIEANPDVVYIGYEIGGLSIGSQEARGWAAALLAAANHAETHRLRTAADNATSQQDTEGGGE